MHRSDSDKTAARPIPKSSPTFARKNLAALGQAAASPVRCTRKAAEIYQRRRRMHRHTARYSFSPPSRLQRRCAGGGGGKAEPAADASRRPISEAHLLNAWFIYAHRSLARDERTAPAPGLLLRSQRPHPAPLPSPPPISLRGRCNPPPSEGGRRPSEAFLAAE